MDWARRHAAHFALSEQPDELGERREHDRRGAGRIESRRLRYGRKHRWCGAAWPLGERVSRRSGPPCPPWSRPGLAGGELERIGIGARVGAVPPLQRVEPRTPLEGVVPPGAE